MKTHVLYFIIGVLLAGNVVLLFKKTPLPPVAQVQTDHRVVPDRVMRLDSLVIRRWSDQAPVTPGFGKPTFLFLFSRGSCPSCVEKIVDFLTRHASPSIETYIISTDINDPVERETFDARYLRSLPFYALEAIRRSNDFDVGLPLLMVVNSRREVLFAKQVLPSDDLQGDYLFWKRINFLYSLLAL